MKIRRKLCKIFCKQSRLNGGKMYLHAKTVSSRGARGITLIALVITIIVLLILAGVSLNLVAGSDGILVKASNAMSETKKATIKEEVELLIAELQMDYYEDYANNKTNYGTALEYVKAQLQTGTKQTGSGVTITYTDPKYFYERTEFTIDTNGNVTVGENTGNTGGATTPIPTATATETPTPTATTTPEPKYTVIYNANGGETTPESETDLVADSIVNLPTLTREGYDFLGWADQQNSKTADYEGSYTVTGDKTLYAVWSPIQSYHAEHPELHIPTGFYVTQDKEGKYLDNVLEGYVITDSDSNEFVWIPVADDTAYTKQAGTNNWDMTSSGENGTILEMVQGDRMLVAGTADTTVLGTIFTDDLVTESTPLNERPEYKIVKNAGGFWVGRYEAGVVSNAERTTYIAGIENWSDDKYNESNAYWDTKTIVVKPGAEPVRTITQVKALEKATNWKSGNAGTGTVAFQSGLITGAGWDAMCKFIGWNICNSSCAEWGNYSNVVSAEYSGFRSNHSSSDWVINSGIKKEAGNRWIFPTGKFVHEGKIDPSTAQKNIFDVAGNVFEWTTEIPHYNLSHSIVRGGAADWGDNCFATSRLGASPSTTRSHWQIGFRIVLYVE